MTRRNHMVAIPLLKAVSCASASEVCPEHATRYSHSWPRFEAAMTTAARLIPASVAKDLHATLARLRTARLVGDHSEALRAERRLDWLLDQVSAALQETTCA